MGEYNPTQVGGMIVGAFLGLLSLSAVLGSFYTVEDGTVGVVSKFGKYYEQEADPGLNWKTPFIEEVTHVDVKLQTVNYKHNTGGYGLLEDGVFIQPQISILDNKNLPIGIDITVQFTPEAGEMDYILRTYGPNYLEKKINPIVRDVVRDVASGYDAENIAKKRMEIGEAMETRLQESFSGLPFTLNAVALRGINLPDSVSEKIRAVQEAKQEEQRLAMVEKQALVNKNIAIIDAEKAAEVARTEAKGVADAIFIKAKAQADANKKVAASLTPLLVKQNQIEKWDGAVPKYQMGENAGVLFQMNADK